MRVLAVTEKQKKAFHHSRLGRINAKVGDIMFAIDYDGNGNGASLGGHVSGYFDGGIASLKVWALDKKRKQVEQARVSYKGVAVTFSDTSEIADAGLRGLAEAMLGARHEADRRVAAANTERIAEDEAAKHAALDHIGRTL
jgi:hypothetical protein